jgi:sRNA-binding carbon storage regulator CsrA
MEKAQKPVLKLGTEIAIGDDVVTVAAINRDGVRLQTADGKSFNVSKLDIEQALPKTKATEKV